MAAILETSGRDSVPAIVIAPGCGILQRVPRLNAESAVAPLQNHSTIRDSARLSRVEHTGIVKVASWLLQAHSTPLRCSRRDTGVSSQSPVRCV
jgi:hypothetical protein